MKAGELMLIRAVVIHHPDFLDVRAHGTNEGDLRLRDARQPACQFADDFVGELMSELADLQVRGTAAIDFANDGRGRRVTDIIEPGLDGDFGSGFGEVAEAHIVGVGRLLDPGGSFQLRRDRNNLGWIEAGAGEIEDATELQVVANDLCEKSGMRFCGVGTRRGVGHGNARFGLAKAGAGPNPILGRGGSAAQ